MTDFIIVGRGLAATVLMHRFHNNGISFKVIANQHLSSCSRIAAGIWNPVVFKRLTKSWLADKLIPELNLFYKHCELKLQIKLITQRPIIKPFAEDQEKALWIKRSKNELDTFLSTESFTNQQLELQHYTIPNEYGIVKQAGNLDAETFLDTSSFFFKEQMISETFDFSALQISEDKINYKGIVAKNIIFCEGFMVKENPFFKWIPLKPVKGEMLDIESDELKLKNSILNKGAFLMDIENKKYKLGATYNWKDLDQEPSQTGREELESKLKQMISCNYKVLSHKAGIRPASIDRRPIIGKHPVYENLFVFNGLGTKGVMLAPFFSENFVNFYLNKESIHPEVDLKRFYHIYEGLQKSKLKLIGRREFVDFPVLGLSKMEAKIDTGAYTSSIHCDTININYENLKAILYFTIEASQKEPFRFEEFTKKKVKNSFGEMEERFVIKTLVKIGKKNIWSTLSLSKRDSMRYPVLIGRRLVKGKFIIDPNLIHTEGISLKKFISESVQTNKKAGK